MKINTGRGVISLLSVIAILSIALVVNLPGIGISPIQDSLTKIFPDAGEKEIQLLVQLPNLLIIPFMFLTGWLAIRYNKIILVVLSLVIYTAAGLLYMLSASMIQLILISCLLGIGAGFIIPLSTGIITDVFIGSERVKQLGLQSGISNIAVVIATFIAGWLAPINWKYPFLVYLVSVIPLILSPFIRKGIKNNSHPAEQSPISIPTQTSATSTPLQSASAERRSGINIGHISSSMTMYFIITFSITPIITYLSFLMADRGFGPHMTGAATSLFFLAIFVPGITLTWMLRCLGKNIVIISLSMICIGLCLIAFVHTEATTLAGVVIAGLGYGTYQPILYDKAADSAMQADKTTLALSFLLSMNYLAISIGPFLYEFLGFDIFHQPESNNAFPFIVAVISSAIVTLTALALRRRFVFSATSEEP